MKKSLFIKSFVFAIMMCGTSLFAQQMPQIPQMPLDPAVRMGTLENGLTYYIRHNATPQNRAEFHIAQKVGSILEEENQRGLAHFLEHMAFNGTKNFPGKTMLEYLEKNGVKFGQNVNAYTSIETTVYNLSDVPTTNQGLIDSCLLILHDWSGYISLEDEEIDNERGVIHEEWRTRNSPSLRMLENDILPALYPNNRYANRMPIGLMEVVDSFPYIDLKEYYYKWYRPDLQAVIIVGDIDVDDVETKIKNLWLDIPAHVDAAERTIFPVEDNIEPLVVVAKDKESHSNSINLLYKQNQIPEKYKNTQVGYVNMYVNSLIAQMINSRFQEMAQKADAPFLGAGAYYGNYLVSNTKDAMTFGVNFKEGEWKPAFEAMMATVNSLNEFGFTQSEYDRAKANYLTMMENHLNEKNTEKNINYAREYVTHFTENVPAPGIDVEYQMISQIAPQIPLEQINNVIKEYIKDTNVAMYMMGVDKEGVINPTNEELLQAFNNSKTIPAVAYEDKVSNIPLMAKAPKPGKVKKQAIGEFDTKIWTLSNGATVVIKNTDFKKDDIIMNVFSKGGKSLVNGNIPDKKVLTDVIDLGGLGELSATDLMKVLAGKRATVSPYISSISEGMDGSSSPKDLETLLQLTNLYFTNNRRDYDAFQSWYNRMESRIKSQEGTPNKVFSDSLNATMYQHNPEYTAITLNELSDINYDRIMDIYSERFANAGDFTFVFVGNVDENELKPLVEKYIASLPAKGKKEKYNESYMARIAEGNIENRFTIPMSTPKVTVFNIYTVDMKYNIENLLTSNALFQVMRSVYTRTIREEEGGTYGVSTYADVRQVPMDECVFIYQFDTSEDKVAKLEQRAYDEFLKVADNGPEKEDFDKVKEFMLKNYDQQIKENGYWLEVIKSKEFFNTDIHSDYLQAINNLTPKMVQDMAKLIITSGNRIQLVSTGIQQ